MNLLWLNASQSTDQSNGCLWPTGMVTDHTMTQDQQYDELFLEHPMFNDEGQMPFHFKTVYEYQQQDPALLELLHRELVRYVVQVLGNYQIICA